METNDLKARSFLLLEEFKTAEPKMIGFSGLKQKWVPIQESKREMRKRGRVGKYDRKAKGITKKISGDDHIK